MALVREWQLQDAKNRFSELIRLAQTSPQTVTVHGRPSAVIVSFEEYCAITKPKQSLLDVMKTAPNAFCDLDISRDHDISMRAFEL